MKRREWIFMGGTAPSWVSLHSVSGSAGHYKARYPNKSNHEAWLHRNYNSNNGQSYHHQQKVTKQRAKDKMVRQPSLLASEVMFKGDYVTVGGLKIQRVPYLIPGHWY